MYILYRGLLTFSFHSILSFTKNINYEVELSNFFYSSLLLVSPRVLILEDQRKKDGLPIPG
jgi:hypothetical protein